MAKKIVILVHQLYEDMELHYPRLRLIEAGVEVTIAGPKKKEEYLGKWGYPVHADIAFDEMKPEEFDGVIIPGGFAPDKIRMEESALNLLRNHHQQKKLIAFICHGGWVPISAGILKGINCTSYQAIKDDIVNAGAKWVDKEVVVDGHIISSRKPNDLPSFSIETLKFLGLS